MAAEIILGREGAELNPIEPRPLHRGWALYEPAGEFACGRTLECAADELADFAARQALGQHRAGWWECDLRDNALTWTAGVYEIFGLPPGSRVGRDHALSLYSEESRATMERLRTDAVANQRGFVLDARIRPADGGPQRWMRLICAPVVEDGRTVRLHGLKLWL